jgi:hypothetical protein
MEQRLGESDFESSVKIIVCVSRQKGMGICAETNSRVMVQSFTTQNTNSIQSRY